MPFTMDDFKKLDSRLNTITSQKVEEFERKSVPVLRQTNGSNQGSVLVRRRIYPSVQTVIQREISMAQDRSRTAVTGSPELPLAHGRTPNRAENSHPQRKAQGFVLTKIF